MMAPVTFEHWQTGKRVECRTRQSLVRFLDNRDMDDWFCIDGQPIPPACFLPAQVRQ